MQITKDKVVMIDYTLTDETGEVLDTSEGREPLAYIHGNGNLIPGLEEALEGKKAGESLKVSVAPEKGYGMRDDSLLQELDKKQFDGIDDIEVGMQFQAQTGAGIQIITVVSVDGDTVTVDGNHPLAGATLNFDVNIKEVRNATEEEISHGHVHGADDHHHH